MPPAKISIRNDGPLLVEGDLELVDMEGKPFGLGGPQRRCTVPLRALRKQAFLRRGA